MIEILNSENLGTLPASEIDRLTKGLEQIGRLKLNGKIYAFHVEDEYAYNQGEEAGYGVELYKRQGDTLREYILNGDRDWVLKVNQVVPRLKAASISKIYTGSIAYQGNFLGLPQECDKDDPIERKELTADDVSEFEQYGIQVVRLENLI